MIPFFWNFLVLKIETLNVLSCFLLFGFSYLFLSQLHTPLEKDSSFADEEEEEDE